MKRKMLRALGSPREIVRERERERDEEKDAAGTRVT